MVADAVMAVGEAVCSACTGTYPSCLALSPEADLYCTRAAGHYGEHIACYEEGTDGRHAAVTWVQGASVECAMRPMLVFAG